MIYLVDQSGPMRCFLPKNVVLVFLVEDESLGLDHLRSAVHRKLEDTTHGLLLPELDQLLHVVKYTGIAATATM